MLQLLLDEHIAPAVAEQLVRRQAEMKILALARWEEGKYLGIQDEELLTIAREQRLTLVTYDRRTIAPLLKGWAESGTDHGGVVFVDDRTYAPNDIGGLVRGLEELWMAQKDLDWNNRVVFLIRA
jgi:hypothetical protein